MKVFTSIYREDDKLVRGGKVEEYLDIGEVGDIVDQWRIMSEWIDQLPENYPNGKQLKEEFESFEINILEI